MNDIYTYIKNKGLPNIKMSNSDKKYLLELDILYRDLMKEVRTKFNELEVKNLEEEREKFFREKKNGNKYYPILDHGNMDFTFDLLKRLIKLRNDFKKFTKCFLSKYYIQQLNSKIYWVNYQIMRHKGFKLEYTPDVLPDEKYYNTAINILKTHQYENPINLKRNINAQQAKEQLEKALDELGFNIEVVLSDNMLTRVHVLPYGLMKINSKSLFNEADIEGLIAHEIKGHVKRLVEAKNLGLNLFVFGLLGVDTLNEGIAIWNSLNLVEKQKPNVLFKIALKYVIFYNKFKMDFCTLFDYIKQLTPNTPDDIIFDYIVKGKREITDLSILGGTDYDGCYLYGYEIVKKLSKQQKNDVQKYSIGPQHLNDIHSIKEFFRVNKFEPIV